MNTFIYQATHGGEYSNYEVCFPIRTEKTLEELCEYLHEAATKHVKYCWENFSSYEEVFYPFEGIEVEGGEYEVLVELCSSKKVRNYLTPINEWKGAKV